MDGKPGLEGYYNEYDHELDPEERVQFRFGEDCPPVDLDALPVLEADSWPEVRLKKAARNYSMDYIRNLIPVLAELLQYCPDAPLNRRTNGNPTILEAIRGDKAIDLGYLWR